MASSTRVKDWCAACGESFGNPTHDPATGDHLPVKYVALSTDDRTPWAVRCMGIDPTVGAGPCSKGLVYMTSAGYNAQMSNPWKTWRCPRCGGDAAWDDDNYESFYDDLEKGVSNEQ